MLKTAKQQTGLTFLRSTTIILLLGMVIGLLLSGGNFVGAAPNVVSTFNTRSGNVTLTAADVTGALTYSPASQTALNTTNTNLATNYYTKAAADSRYALPGSSYTKAESDGRYALAGSGGGVYTQVQEVHVNITANNPRTLLTLPVSDRPVMVEVIGFDLPNAEQAPIDTIQNARAIIQPGSGQAVTGYMGFNAAFGSYSTQIFTSVTINYRSSRPDERVVTDPTKIYFGVDFVQVFPSNFFYSGLDADSHLPSDLNLNFTVRFIY